MKVAVFLMVIRAASAWQLFTSSRDRKSCLTARIELQTIQDAFAYSKGRTEWKDVRGSKSWAGLLPGTKDAAGKGVESLNTLLRTELIKYGELTQVTYDGFEKRRRSHSFGQPYFEYNELLKEAAGATWSKISDTYEIPSPKDYIHASASLYDTKVFNKLEAQANGAVKPAAWIGYIAVTKDDKVAEAQSAGKDIVVAFRGTILDPEWGIDAQVWEKNYSSITNQFKWTPMEGDKKEEHPHVLEMHTGFWTMYTTAADLQDGSKISPQEVVRERLKQLVEENKGKVKSVTFVGHSLGGALATVAAADIGVMKKYDKWFRTSYWKDISLTAYTYAAPRVADVGFRDMLQAVNVHVLNIVNYGDVVPCIPAGIRHLSLLPDKIDAMAHTLIAFAVGLFPRRYWQAVSFGLKVLPAAWQYTDSGAILFLDSAQSHQIRKLKWHELSAHHNLEGYLFMLAKQHASDDNPPIWRDVALINKSSDLLEETLADEEGIPACWWSPAKHLGLVTHTQGKNVVWRDRGFRPGFGGNDKSAAMRSRGA